ncbi:MAG: YihY/virulence factor BrkB family protein [Chloroflexi bacterium]|nr:YihY/virulence factor BrkB family protein [Chloroflexota bacterium]
MGILRLFKDTFVQWNEDHAPRLGAAVAYYTVFSIGPLLIIVIALASLIFGQETARDQILRQIQGLIGQQGAQFIAQAIDTTRRPSSNILASLIGIGTLLLGALGVFGELKNSLNAIWGVEPKPGRGLKGLILDRLLSFGMILVTGFLLIVSLTISTSVTAIVSYFGGTLTASPTAIEIANFVLSFIVITILFAFIFKYLPDAHVKWTNALLGAALTSLLFAIGKFLIGFYLGRSQLASAYGAASSVIIVLVWIYYAAQILFFGAEFTKVSAMKFGSGIIPDPDAQPIGEKHGTPTT